MQGFAWRQELESHSNLIECERSIDVDVAEGRVVVRMFAAAVVASATVVISAQEPIPPALAAMAETEREFAAAARVKGIRDSFLEFFADDAIGFEPDPVKAKDQLGRQKPQPFSVRELVWEPRMGDVAASGELGWLTGPSTFVNHAAEDKSPRYGNYLSVWRKESDGRWRVFLDVGTNLKAPAEFSPGLTQFRFARGYAGKEGKAAAADRLMAADRTLNDRIASTGAAAAYREALAPGARVHREGVGALTTEPAVRAWMERNAVGMTAKTGAAESAASGDLGYSYGTYQIGSAKPGAYLRVWIRDADARWWVVADVVQPPSRR